MFIIPCLYVFFYTSSVVLTSPNIFLKILFQFFKFSMFKFWSFLPLILLIMPVPLYFSSIFFLSQFIDHIFVLFCYFIFALFISSPNSFAFLNFLKTLFSFTIISITTLNKCCREKLQLYIALNNQLSIFFICLLVSFSKVYYPIFGFITLFAP